MVEVLRLIDLLISKRLISVANSALTYHFLTAMIIRVFRATVHPGHETEFERKFREVSLPLVRAQTGLISCVIGRPVASSPNEFLMIST